MSIKIKNIEPNKDTIHKQLIFTVDVFYDYKYVFPLQITGVLKTGKDNKEIAQLTEYKNYRHETYLNIMDRATQYKVMQENIENRENFKLLADLSPKAIEHIENIRQKQTPQDVDFRIELEIKQISAIYDYTKQSEQIKNNNEEQRINQAKNSQKQIEKQYNTEFIKINIVNEQDTITIKQSEWITKFTEILGIGKFSLIELKMPELENQVIYEWKDIYDRMILRINNTEDYIKKGEWQSAFLQLRNFFELFKNEDFKTYLKELFIKDKHEEVGVKEFYEGINKFFHFLSKYVHDNNQKQRLKSVPIANKEDVYLFYSLALSILNLISKKLIA